MFMIGRLRSLKQSGDTLIEVMLAIAIISSILGGAYVTTNKSLRATRGAQEHTNALKLAEGQTEQLKNLAETNPAVVFSGVSPFCINSVGAVAASNAACLVSSNGTPTTVQPMYQLSISRAGNLFTTQATWTTVTTSTTASEQIKYRIYQ